MIIKQFFYMITLIDFILCMFQNIQRKQGTKGVFRNLKKKVSIYQYFSLIIARIVP